jgi:predicted MPP superfamily phosphohydrolase
MVVEKLANAALGGKLRRPASRAAGMISPRTLIRLGIVLSLVALAHRYVWARVVRDPAWPAPWGKLLTVAIIVLAASVPLVLFTARSSSRALAVPLAWVAYTWMGFLLYLFLLTVLSDAGRGVAALLGALPRDPERRRFLARVIGGGIAGAAGLVGLGGLLNVARGFRVRRVRIPLARLPSHASGYTIVQLTDVHVGPTLGRAYVESVVHATNALGPDLVVITGDLVDGSVAELGPLVEPLRDLVARHGVFFVTGNHEYYSGAEAWIAHLPSLGIRVLRNERVDVGGLFDLAGVDDASASRVLPHHGQDVARATEGRDGARPLVLLAHQPKAVTDAVKAGVDLQLSGHVHGGQMVPFNWFARLAQPLVAGLYRVQATWVYVSSGTGYWGPPMRVGTGSEIAHIELVSDGA